MANLGDRPEDGDSIPSAEFRPGRALQPSSLPITTVYDPPDGRWGSLDDHAANDTIRSKYYTEPLNRPFPILPDLRTSSDNARVVIGPDNQVEDRISISFSSASQRSVPEGPGPHADCS